MANKTINVTSYMGVQVSPALQIASKFRTEYYCNIVKIGLYTGGFSTGAVGTGSVPYTGSSV